MNEDNLVGGCIKNYYLKFLAAGKIFSSPFSRIWVLLLKPGKLGRGLVFSSARAGVITSWSSSDEGVSWRNSFDRSKQRFTITWITSPSRCNLPSTISNLD